MMACEEVLHTRMGYMLPWICIASLVLVLASALKLPWTRKRKIVVILVAPLALMLEVFVVALLLFQVSGLKYIQDEIR